MSEIIYPENLSLIIDVTKPPFSVVPDGKTDCTKGIKSAIDFVVKKYITAFNKTKSELEKEKDDDALLSFEVRKAGGLLNIPFPKDLPKANIIYFPKGTYLVSDTLTYSYENFYNILFSVRWLEIAGLLRFVGQEKKSTVIKLKDGAKGFEFGARKPVINFCNGEKTGVAMSNLLQNLTVDIGKNNPGAVGVRFVCNNTGLVKDVDIKSTDDNLRGYAGFEIVDEKVSCANIENLTVTGFDYGVRVTPQQHCATFENITLINQKIAGFYQKGSIVAVKNLKSYNSVSAVHLVGFTGHLSIVDSELFGGSAYNKAINAEYGFCYFRNIKAKGYDMVFEDYFKHKIYSENIPYEYSTHPVQTLFKNLPDVKSFDTKNLPAPPEFSTDYRNFKSVKEFGASGNGVSDDTEAIASALKSGAEGIYFEEGKYLITKQISVPEHIRVIDFMFCDLLMGEDLAKNENSSVFKTVGAGEPICFKNLLAWEDFHGLAALIDHSAKRNILMEMLHTQAAPLYKSNVGNIDVFINGCACTLGGVPGAGARTEKLKNEEKFIDARHIPAFSFKNQRVYAKALNPERGETEVVNDGGEIIVLGGKTEDRGTSFYTINGGKTQVLGFSVCIGADKEIPIIKSVDSHTFAVLSTMINNPGQKFPIAVSDTKNNVTKIIKDSELPKRAMLCYTLPGYLG